MSVATDSSMVVTRGKEGWGAVEGEGGQLYGDGRWFDLSGKVHYAFYQNCIIETHIILLAVTPMNLI